MLSEEEKGEMRMSYRQAADRRRQIAILSQLYAVSKEEVLDVLELKEQPEPIRTARKPKTERRRWPEAVRNAAVQDVLAGKSYRQAAEKQGVPVNTLRGWMATWWRMRRREKQL